MPPARHSAAALVALVLAAAPGCGGDDPAGSKGPAVEAPARDRGPAVEPITMEQAAAITLGTPRARVHRMLGDALPIDDYALTASERRSCEYHPIKTSYGRVSYDNVFRFCFKDGRLYTFSTAPSREAAGPDAGKESRGEPGGALTRGAD